jgi:peptide/nickel transport system substrate-binding protein
MSRSPLIALRAGAAILLTLVGSALAIGCGGTGSTSSRGESDVAEGVPGGVLRIAQLADPNSLTPSEVIGTAATEVSAQISEPLFKQNEEGKIVPLLATGYKRTADGLTWVFPIRKGVTFSDGKSLTATDVVFSLNAARKSPIYASYFEDFESVKALSPTSVQVRTKKPMAAMLADLTFYAAAIVPDNYGGVSEKEFAQHPVGTGPFVLKSWTHGQSVTLVKNPSYWDSTAPLLDEVVFSTVPDDNSRISQFRGGEVDLIGQPAWSQLKSLEQAPGVQVGNFGLYQVDTLVLNMNRPLFKDRRVREAVNLAIDREGVIAAALNGYGEPAGSFLPPTMPFTDQSIKAPAQDLNRARKLLAEAVQDGVDPSFTLTTFAGQAYGAAASQIVQQDLNEVGFKVELQPLDEAALIEESVSGNLDAQLIFYYAGLPDPSELTNLYIQSVSKPNGGRTQPLEELAGRASSELDLAKRQALYEQIQEAVAEELLLVPLDYAPAIWTMQEGVTGLEVNSIDTIWLNHTGFTE